jgi:NDP-sugar pyrophosphorylase family protein
MIVTELNQGIKLYLLVGGRGTRLASITKGMPKPLVDVHDNPFLDYVLNNLKGFDITLVCSNLNYEHFRQYKDFGIDIFNEGDPSGTAGFLCKVHLPESFYVMNGDTFFSGDLNLDCNTSTLFAAEEDVTPDVGYIRGKNGKVESYVEKNPNASGRELVSLGIYKFYKKDLTIPMRLPLSMEYDILPGMNLSYKVLDTERFDIGTPERLERFKTWLPSTSSEHKEILAVD